MTTDNVTPIPPEAERNAPAAIPGYQIADILDHSDNQLGEYLYKGRELDLRGAIEEALQDADALLDILSSVDVTAIAEATAPGTLARLAWIAQGKIERVRSLRERAEGSSEGACR